jgi:hypothetical protein
MDWGKVSSVLTSRNMCYVHKYQFHVGVEEIVHESTLFLALSDFIRPVFELNGIGTVISQDSAQF